MSEQKMNKVKTTLEKNPSPEEEERYQEYLKYWKMVDDPEIKHVYFALMRLDPEDCFTVDDLPYLDI